MNNEANSTPKQINSSNWQWDIAFRTDGDWGRNVLEWRPWISKRIIGRPQIRRTDKITLKKPSGSSRWIHAASNRGNWSYVCPAREVRG